MYDFINHDEKRTSEFLHTWNLKRYQTLKAKPFRLTPV